MMVKVTFRKAVYDDVPFLVNMLFELFSIEADFEFDPEKQSKGLEELIKNKDYGEIFTALYKNKIAGMCSLQYLISTAQGSKSAVIEDVIIHRDFRRQGIGKAMLEFLEDFALKQNISRLQLLADSNNKRALSFYKNIGYKKTRLVCLRKFLIK